MAGDAATLATQLRQILEGRPDARGMTCDQLASCYSIKHRVSVVEMLRALPTRGRNHGPLTLLEFLENRTGFEQRDGRIVLTSIGRGGHGGAVSSRAPPGGPPTGAAGPVGSKAAAPGPTSEEERRVGPMTYADVSRGLQRIFKERQEALTLESLEETFASRFGVTIREVTGVGTAEYLRRKENVFEYDKDKDRVFLQPSILAGPPIADPNLPKDEKFVVDELERLVEDSGPVCYISALCGKFIQRNGVSVSSITSVRPLDLFKRHPDRFIVVGGGNVSLVRFKDRPEVQSLLAKSVPRSQRAGAPGSGSGGGEGGNMAALQEADLRIPEAVTEADVVEEFRRLILQDGTGSVYISSLCGRFLQRFKKPVTAIIGSRPADFLRKYPEVFTMTGGGHVGLREIIGDGGADAAGVAELCDGNASDGDADGDLDDGTDFSNGAARLDGPTCEAVLSYLVPAGLATTAETQVRELGELLKENCFLAVEEVVVGGAVGKGLASRGLCDAEVAILVDKLPQDGHAAWLPHILETLRAVLEMALGKRARGFRADGGRLSFVLCGAEATEGVSDAGASGGSGDVPTTIVLSPIFETSDRLMQLIRAAPPRERKHYEASLVKDATQLVAGQPSLLKGAMRLVRWWLAQQRWGSAHKMPSAYLAELVAIHVWQLHGKMADQAQLVEHVLEFFANFGTLKVTWAETSVALYDTDAIWRPLLAQEPLLMDPTNPYANVADPAIFDCAELVRFAKEADRLRCFRRRAARLRLSSGASAAGAAA